MSGRLTTARSSGSPAECPRHCGGPGCSAAADFAHVIPDLALHRSVYAVDLDQYGQSPSVAIAGYSAEHHAGRLAATLDELGIAGADFVCQSLGGLVALELAATRPDLVRRLVVTGSQPIPGDPSTCDWELGPEMRRRVYAAGTIDEARIRSLQATSEWWDADAIPPALTARRLRATLLHHERIPGADAAARGTWKDMTARLPAVGAPVLLLWGASDPFARPAYALGIAALLPDATVHVIPRSSHHVQSERPREYTRAALSFLLDTPPAPDQKPVPA